MKITIVDDGKEFNILDAPEHEAIDKSIEDREVGGLGIHFIRTLTDKIEYERKNGKNMLILFLKINKE